MNIRSGMNGHILNTEEDVITLGKFYLSILENMKDRKKLSDIELREIKILLLNRGNELISNPKKYMTKKGRGAPNKHTKQWMIKQILIYAKLGLAKNLSEAREKLAVKLLTNETDFSEHTYEELLAKKIRAIETHTKNLDYQYAEQTGQYRIRKLKK